MEQNVNMIIDNLNTEWANDMLLVKRRMAILIEENHRLKIEIEKLQGNKEEKTNA